MINVRLLIQITIKKIFIWKKMQSLFIFIHFKWILISFYVNSNKSLIKTLFVNKYVKVDLDKNLLDFLLNGRDLRLNLRSFVLGDGSGNHWTGDPTSAAKSWNIKIITMTCMFVFGTRPGTLSLIATKPIKLWMKDFKLGTFKFHMENWWHI